MVVLISTIILVFCSSILAMEPSVISTQTPEDTAYNMAIDEMFPVVDADLSTLPMTDLTHDCWIYLGSHLDASSLWNLGLTCKTVGAVLRQSGGFPTLFKQFSPGEVLDMLSESELTIGEWADALMTRNNLAGMKIIQADARLFQKFSDWFNLQNTDAWFNLQSAGEKLIFDTFFPRIKNLLAEQILQVRIGNHQFIEVTVPEVFHGNVFRLQEGFLKAKLFYLPESKDKKLFDLVDPSTLGRLTWCKAYEGGWTLFTCSILADYVLPAWRKEYTLSSHEKTCIRALAKDAARYFQPYFDNLIWAVFFISGVSHDFRASTLEPIIAFLEDLGFVWCDLMDGKYNNDMNDKAGLLMEGMESIYAVAIQWNLDLMKLAEATLSNHISLQILSGDLPLSIFELAELHERNIFSISYKDLTSNLTKVDVVDGRFSVTSHPASLKRKREQDNASGEEGCVIDDQALVEDLLAPVLFNPVLGQHNFQPFFPPALGMGFGNFGLAPGMGPGNFAPGLGMGMGNFALPPGMGMGLGNFAPGMGMGFANIPPMAGMGLPIVPPAPGAGLTPDELMLRSNFDRLLDERKYGFLDEARRLRTSPSTPYPTNAFPQFQVPDLPGTQDQQEHPEAESTGTTEQLNDVPESKF